MKSLIEQMAEALLARDALLLRELTLEWERHREEESAWDGPASGDERVRIAAAALAELLSGRAGRSPPSWTRTAGSLREPFFALAAASRLPSVRRLCEKESPEALRRHGILAPANFLELV